MQLPDTRDGNRKVKLADRSEHNNVYAKFAVIALVNWPICGEKEERLDGESSGIQKIFI